MAGINASYIFLHDICLPCFFETAGSSDNHAFIFTHVVLCKSSTAPAAVGQSSTGTFVNTRQK